MTKKLHSKQKKDTMRFRLEFSREKLQIASLLLNNNKLNDAALYSYLSIFFSLRTLLVHDGQDSDDYNEIVNLYNKYYQAYEGLTVDVSTIIAETYQIKKGIESGQSLPISKERVQEYVDYAGKVHNEITNLVQDSLKD